MKTLLFLISLIGAVASAQVSEKTLGRVVAKERTFQIKIGDCEKNYELWSGIQAQCTVRLAEPLKGLRMFFGPDTRMRDLENEPYTQETYEETGISHWTVDRWSFDVTALPSAKNIGVGQVEVDATSVGYVITLQWDDRSSVTESDMQKREQFSYVKPVIQEAISHIKDQKIRFVYFGLEQVPTVKVLH
jgi:hypothetical protein